MIAAFETTRLASMVGLGVVLCLLITLDGILTQRRRARLLWARPAALAEPVMVGPLLAGTCQTIGLLLVVLVGIHLASAPGAPGGGSLWQSLVVALSALTSSVALYALLGRLWRPLLAGVATVLLTMSVCGVALGLAGAGGEELSGRVPVRCNALLVALAVMAGFWPWIAGVWTQQLDEGRAWTTAGRMHGLTRGFALGTGLVAAAAAWLMSLWPLLTEAPGSDASWGRMAFGAAGQLLLVWTLLRCRRRWPGPPFVVLAGAGVASLVLFVVVRLVVAKGG